MQRDPKHYRDFEFNLRELAGSMGNFGTFFPLTVGFVAGLACTYLIKWLSGRGVIKQVAL